MSSLEPRVPALRRSGSCRFQMQCGGFLQTVVRGGLASPAHTHPCPTSHSLRPVSGPQRWPPQGPGPPESPREGPRAGGLRMLILHQQSRAQAGPCEAHDTGAPGTGEPCLHLASGSHGPPGRENTDPLPWNRCLPTRRPRAAARLPGGDCIPCLFDYLLCEYPFMYPHAAARPPRRDVSIPRGTRSPSHGPRYLRF